MTLLAPETEAPGKLWAFRADSVRGDEAIDLALLARGFHIVVGPVPYDALGPSTEQWNALYDHLVVRGFSRKPVMEGSGGAAGEVYAWAIENPGKVSCVYGENPVFRSATSEGSLLDRLAPLARAGVPLMHVCGALDPWLDQHARVLETRYRELGGRIALLIKEGVGRHPLAPEDRETVTAFLFEAVAGTSSK
jgi:hypothetical protein